MEEMTATIGTEQTANDSLTQSIVTAVADVRDVDPLEAPPLYDAVDLEALERLVASIESGTGTTGRVAFRMDGCEVVVHSDRDVEATQVEETGP